MLITFDQHRMFYQGGRVVDQLKQYFISITVCAILCTIITGLFQKNSSMHALIKTICGLFMIFTFVHPVTNIQLTEMTDFTHVISDQAQAAISAGETYRIESLAAIIKEEAETYILDKAQSLNCTLDVEVIVEKDDPPYPAEVYITGQLSDNEKSILQEIIAQDLHIAKENQIWIR